MDRVLIIGAGAAGSVVAQKCAMDRETFQHITLASRRLVSCEKVAALCETPIEIAQVDADNVEETVALIAQVKPDLVINMALPYQDLPIMDACLATKTHYMDTANYEPRDVAKFEYHWQWAYHERFKEAGLTAILGCGFDPGCTNIYCAYAQQEGLFDEIEYIDIVDCNAGDHGKTFATNFNPEINIREITQNGRYWEAGEWKEVEPMSVHQVYDFPVVGPQDAYLLYHEEMESLCQNIKGLKRIRFWMTFSEKYLTHLRVLENVGMTSIEPIDFQGKQVQPIEFLKAVLPDPASLGPRTKGKTCIGCDIMGTKNGKKKRIFIYNSCDHQDCYKEVSSQAISYTTGVPAMIGAQMILKGLWKEPGVWNMEQRDPDPFMEELNQRGLPWQVIELPLES